MAMNILATLEKGVTTASAEATRELAAEFASALPPDTILAFHGNLGVGKTTFIQGFATGLGISAAITSPTFNIYSIHQGKQATLIHLDAYRLNGGRQMESLMLEDFMLSPYYLAIEWPENIADWLPSQTRHLFLDITRENTHSIRLETRQ